MQERRQGQVWSLDYSVGFILFTLSLILAIAFLSRSFSVDDSFSQLLQQGERVAEHLVSEGYPNDWRQDDLLVPGLLTSGKLSMRKVERFAQLADDEYDMSRRLLNTDEEYALTIWWNGSHLPIGDRCFLGSADVTEQKNTFTEIENVAYYATTSTLLEPFMIALNATRFDETSVGAFFDNLSRFDLVILEEPDLGGVKPPYDAQKAFALEAYVQEGGRLLMIGNVNLSEAFDLNLTLVNTSENGSATGNDSYLNLSMRDLDGVPAGAFALKSAGQRRYTSAITLADGRDVAASFTYGDGDVHYLATLDGTIRQSGLPLLNHTVAALNQSLNVTRAQCTSVSLPVAKDRVAIRRLAALDGKIVTLHVSLWRDVS